MVTGSIRHSVARIGRMKAMTMMSQLSKNMIAPNSSGTQRRRVQRASASSIAAIASEESIGWPSAIEPLRIAAEEGRTAGGAETFSGVPGAREHGAVGRGALADVRAPDQPLGPDQAGEPADERGRRVAGILEPLE